VDHAQHCALAEAEVLRFAEVVRDVPDLGAVPVPTCPDWTLADLVLHTGSVHRWAAQMVGSLAQARLPSADVVLDLPDDVSGYPDWLAAGAELLVSAFAAADPDAPMWAWGADQHARFWPRRMLHETTVHRGDAELALGLAPVVSAPVACDGVEEFLANLPCAAYFAPGVRELVGDGETLAFDASSSGAGACSWLVRLEPSGFSWARADPAAGDVVVRAAPGELLLFLYGRRAVGDEGITVSGDTALLDRWVRHSRI
jgi:uncharacterized protein (TIGR03083 family)